MENLKRKPKAKKLELDAVTVQCAEASTEPDFLFARKRGGNG